MIAYYPNIQFTFSEIKNTPVLLIHSLEGCIFHCFKCINYDELISKKHPHIIHIQEVIDTIRLQDGLFEQIVISGGEFLISPIEEIISDLHQIRNITDKPIIIYTTGFFLKKMKILHQKGLVNGFHIDMKLPYHLLQEEDKDLIHHTFGKDISIDQIHRMMEAIDYTISIDQGYSQIRSVKYPFLHQSAFDECRLHIHRLNEKHHKVTPYQTHSFIDLSLTT